MVKVSICIPYVAETWFLLRNVAQIKKHRHPYIEYELLLMDQTGNSAIAEHYANDPEIKVIPTQMVDAGHPIDKSLQYSTGSMHCTLDVDALPMSPLWLYLPVKCIEKFGFTMVGKQTGLHNAYKQQIGYSFCGVNNYFRVMPTHVAQQLSNEVGFMRPENRYKINFKPLYDNWPGSADNGVLVNYWSDKQHMGPKLSLAMDNYMGKTVTSGLFGFTIDSLVWHMVFAYPDMQNPTQALGQEYLDWISRIKNEGLTEQLLDEILSQLQPLYSTKTDREIFQDGVLSSIGEGHPVYEYIEAIKRGEV